MEDNDLPPLVPYDQPLKPIDVKQYLPKKQTIKTPNQSKQNTPQTLTIQKPSPQNVTQISSQVLSQDTSPTRKKSKPNLNTEEIATQNKKIEPIIITQVNQPELNANDYESDRLVESFLRNLTASHNYLEIENLSDAMIQKLIQKIEVDQQQESSKIKNFRAEQKAMNKNDYRIIYIDQEVQLLNDKLILMEQVKNLFRDKITLRTQVYNQKTIINDLANRIVKMEYEFTQQIHQLKIYNATLPTERERQLDIKIKNLEKVIEQEKKLREELESAVAINISTFQSLFNEAQEAKTHIIEQLKQIRIKKDQLNKEDQEKNNKINANRFGPDGQRQSFHSSNSGKQQPTHLPLSKILQKSENNSFSKKSDSVLNKSLDKQQSTNQVKLGTIRENDNHSQSVIDETMDNAMKINMMVQGAKSAFLNVEKKQ